MPDTATRPADAVAVDRWTHFRTRLEHFVDTRSVPFAVWLIRMTHGQAAWRLYRRRALVLTTRGRRSGQERSVVVQYFLDGDDLVVVAANSGLDRPPAWSLNLTADPRATVEVAGERIEVVASELRPSETEAFWPRVLQAAPDYDRYRRRTRRPISMFRLRRVEAPTEAGRVADGRRAARPPAPSSE